MSIFNNNVHYAKSQMGCYKRKRRGFLLLEFLIALLLLAFLSSPAMAQTGKTATVDMRKLFDDYWKTKQADAALNDRKAELDKEDRSFIDDLHKQFLISDIENCKDQANKNELTSYKE